MDRRTRVDELLLGDIPALLSLNLGLELADLCTVRPETLYGL
jgi:hypothetical protein